MAVVITPIDSTLRIKTKTGTLESGADQIRSVSLSGVDRNADAQLLMDVTNAIGGLIAAPVVGVLRIDENAVVSE
ncbi:MAG: DUF1659 domain-containing protein [Pyramidobacter sp.]|nr:DUF1659 domain-containing protein [Pyramidobacter sp.]